MTEHVFDDLPLLLSGDATRDEVATVSAHLRECDDCRHELISAVVSHAALRSAVRYAPGLRAETFTALGDESEVAPPLPDMSLVFSQIRDEIEAAPSITVRAPGHAGRRWLAAAAAIVVIGGGTATAVGLSGSSVPTRSVALAPFGSGTVPAAAKVVGSDHLQLRAADLPALGDGKYYEVWLTNADRTAMAAVGQLDASRSGNFAVKAAELGGYSAVEVSVQNTDADGAYSGVSVLRGSYRS